MTFRQQGMSLAQIAEQQKVDPQVLIDALAAQWSVRIDARVAAGALTADQAAALKAEVAVRAKAMVNQVTPGGMRGAAVGAGPNGAGPNGAARGMGAGAAGRVQRGRGSRRRDAWRGFRHRHLPAELHRSVELIHPGGGGPGPRPRPPSPPPCVLR